MAYIRDLECDWGDCPEAPVIVVINNHGFTDGRYCREHGEKRHNQLIDMKPPSRTQRWANAAGDAVTALTELQEIQQEFSDWKDNLPENLEYSALGKKLSAICDLDLDTALDAVNEAEGADLPLDFGRD